MEYMAARSFRGSVLSSCHRLLQSWGSLNRVNEFFKSAKGSLNILKYIKSIFSFVWSSPSPDLRFSQITVVGTPSSSCQYSSTIWNTLALKLRLSLPSSFWTDSLQTLLFFVNRQAQEVSLFTGVAVADLFYLERTQSPSPPQHIQELSFDPCWDWSIS